MGTSRGRGSRALVALAALIASMVVAAPGAQAGGGDPTTRIRATNDTCVQGEQTVLPGGAAGVRVALLSGTTERDAVQALVNGGEWLACFDQVPRPDMRVVVRSVPGEELLASLTIPKLSVRIDRVKDVVQGSGPKHKSVQIRISDCSVTQLVKNCPNAGTRTVTVDGSGTYRKDLTSAHDLRGMDELEVRYTDASGDRFSVYAGVPTLYLNVDQKTGRSMSRPDTEGRYRLLKRPGGDQLSRRTVTSSRFGFAAFEFSARITAGRQVRSDIASDAVVTVVPVSSRVEEVGDDQVIHVRCLPDRKLSVDLDAGRYVLTAGHDGRASMVSPIELGGDPAIVVRCQTPKGDVLIAGPVDER